MLFLDFKIVECSWVYAIVAKTLLSYISSKQINFCKFQTDAEAINC